MAAGSESLARLVLIHGTRPIRDAPDGGVPFQQLSYSGVPMRVRNLSATALFFGVPMLVAACVGTTGDPAESNESADGDEQPSEQCSGVVDPGPSPIRRLTRFEYNRTVHDLLGDTSEPANAFVAEEESLGFNNQATSLGVTQLLAEQYLDAAESVSGNVDLEELLPCDAAGEEVACGKHFITEFGARAFRRPLEDETQAWLEGVFLDALAIYDFSTSIRLVIQVILQSPDFLYRVELAGTDGGEGDVVRLDDYEMASRLSYLFWGSMPDDELFAAAAEGALQTPAELEAHARRMLADDRARAMVASFHAQWLGLAKLELADKDPVAFPDWHMALVPALSDETVLFLEDVVFDGAGDLTEMLTAPYSMMNAEVASFYGESGPTGDAYVRVDLDPERRAGLLTHASIMAANAKYDQSAPVQRGLFVRERLLCHTPPPPPDNVDTTVPVVDPNVSTRDRLAQHSADPACASCHQLLDPVGFGFEHYDAVGQWRDMDGNVPVDATGELLQTDDIDGAFDGAIELGATLASSDQVRSCLVRQWFRFAYGRGEQTEDACTLDTLERSFSESDQNVQELLVALTQTDAFQYRYKVEAE